LWAEEHNGALLFQQFATRNPLWTKEHHWVSFSNKLQQEIHCEQNTMELAFPTICNKRAWALDSFTIVPGSLCVCKSKCTLHYLFMSWLQQASFGSRDPNTKIWGTPRREFNKILAFPCFQVILSTKCKTESVLAAWRNKRGHVKMEEFIPKWVLEVEIGKFLWARYCSQNTSCPFPSSSGFLTSFAVLKQKPWEREGYMAPKRWWKIPQQDVVHRLQKQ
jgi:hypothetical protein